MMCWWWHQLNHAQIICTSLHTDNHGSTTSFNFYRPDVFLMPNQQCQSSESKTFKDKWSTFLQTHSVTHISTTQQPWNISPWPPDPHLNLIDTLAP